MAENIEDDLPEQLRIRREKRENLLGRGVSPYPVSVPRTATLKEIRTRFKDLEIDKEAIKKKYKDLTARINKAVESEDLDALKKLMKKIYLIRTDIFVIGNLLKAINSQDVSAILDRVNRHCISR